MKKITIIIEEDNKKDSELQETIDRWYWHWEYHHRQQAESHQESLPSS